MENKVLKKLKKSMMKAVFMNKTFSEGNKKVVFTLISIPILFIILLSNLPSDYQIFNGNSTSKAILDNSTLEKISYTDKQQNDMVLYYKSDNMDRINMRFFNQKIIIENIDSGMISRGDILYYKENDEYQSLGRVVGLPNETVKMDNGQLFINNRPLDTFYGKVHILGMNIEEFLSYADENGYEYNSSSIKEIYETNFEDKVVSNNEVYVISDNWHRGNSGIIDTITILGRVKGILK
ncbi:S26 family signal peptidase [Alkalihalobacillus pseudalcaliphilus]|uniref:S26 family signal peptidase n=1 Tax=Alkalihalobacillus pseudalcaliphilus TaxID=79884 RepID=UPI00064DD3DE|nr:S26 family signal peptidase [Alkalihalobacillus pseudalcaliphilus]KMK76330.1 hypothetical protein AB990_14085 [Alkalihalobacillus pseudalcaliphilus]